MPKKRLKFSFNLSSGFKKRAPFYAGILLAASSMLAYNFQHHNDVLSLYDVNAQDYDLNPNDQSLVVWGPDYARYKVNGFEGLSEKELSTLVDEFTSRIKNSAILLEDVHYFARKREEIRKGFELGDLIIRMNPDKDYSNKEIKQLVEIAAKEMVKSQDVRSGYLTHREAIKYKAMLKGEQLDLGFKITKLTEEGLLIDQVRRDTVSEEILKDGDVIVSINGQSLAGLTVKQVEGIIIEILGKDTVEYEVKRRGQENALKVTMPVTVDRVSPVTSSIYNNDTLVIKLNIFSRGAAQYVRDAVAEATQGDEHKIDSIIIDLRNNPGGSLHELYLMLDDFIDEGRLFNVRERVHNKTPYMNLFGEETHVDNWFMARKGTITDLETSVLVNNNSASASEIFAGVMQHVGRGTVYGESNTRGKASGQTLEIIPGQQDEFASLKTTYSLVYIDEGYTYQAEGITPDVKVSSSVELNNLFFEKLHKNHIPNPENYVAPEAKETCDVTNEYKQNIGDVWIDVSYPGSGTSERVNINQDRALLCALENMNGEQRYTEITPNLPSV